MLAKLKALRGEREEGFTLIELLVVILIIGILAAIAIPVFLNQRQTANDGAVESDVRNAVSQVETWITSQGGKEVTIDSTALSSMSIKKSSSVIMTVRGTSNSYCVVSSHPNGKKNISSNAFIYDSTKGTPGNGSTYCSAPAIGSVAADGKTIANLFV